MGRHKETQQIIDQAYEIMAGLHPQSLRQVYYQLVSRQVIENNRGRYQSVSDALVAARKEGAIPWEWMEDRGRKPREVQMWDGLAAFAETAQAAYRLDVWADQPQRVEVWLEKDALSGIFEDALFPYGVTLNVGKGYDGWDSIHNAAKRFGCGEDVTVLYFGDFDPSGEDMFESLGKRLAELDSKPKIIKVALTLDDIKRYNLPPNLTKDTDSRQKAFVAKNGLSVELDALPAAILRSRLIEEVEQRLDMEALKRTQDQEAREREQLVSVLQKIR